MRNLRNTKHKTFCFDKNECTATTWDFDDLICAFGPTESHPAITLRRLPVTAASYEDAETIVSWDSPSPNPDLLFDRILHLHCFADNRVICIVLEGGDIVLVRQEPQPGEELIEIVGSVDVGVSAAAWSPDGELLAIATKADTVLFMTREYEPTANITLTPEDVNVSNHVSVGWGKKETQFKGRGAAKALRDPTMPEHVDEGSLSAFDDGRASISWRGDGQYVAVNSVLHGKRRMIRVYSREGTLESVSEPVNGLEGALSWKPSGQTIAGVQRLQDKVQVVFFERNGLRHGEFDLRLGADESQTYGKEIGLCWNIDSTVLAVSLSDRVQLWTVSNYHWDLKQELRMSSHPHISWHPEKPLHLACADSAMLLGLSYRFDVCHGSVAPPHDLGLVAVIDGTTLKVTPLRVANVPPPMALDEVELPSSAVDVAFNEIGTEFAVMHAGEVTLWTCDYALKPPGLATLRSRRAVPGSLGDVQGRKVVVYSAEDEPLAISRSDHSSVSYAEDCTSASVPNGHRTSQAASSATSKTWQDTNGEIITFELSEQGVLHITPQDANALRIQGCTSFIVTQDHLIYTTSQHLLKFVHLKNSQLEVPLDEPEKDERCRNIERGAKLVTVIPSAYSLILQMPRGNLETIYPRALVLAGIRRSVGDRDYKTAFKICRTHRVDMNILHDHAPEQFMRDVELFVKHVKKAEYIDLFLSSLSEDDVAVTMYKETLRETSAMPPGADVPVQGSQTPDAGRTDSKVNRICNAFLRILNPKPSYLQSVITAHVCKQPPDLEAGLSLVSKLRSGEQHKELEQAVEHICFLADVNQLYETALGLYDLEVTLLVAQQSQKDPREYLPYLQTLQDMPNLRQRFAIDNDLKRYRKALTNLHAMDDWDQLRTYVVKHELYGAAMELYRYDTDRLHELMRLHADYLSSRNRYKEAGLAYEYVHDYEMAYEAYRSANMWRECLAAAALAPVPDSSLVDLAKNLASSLEEAKDFSAAATVTLDYLKDVDGAVRLLGRGYHFAEAMRLAAMHRKPNLLNIVDQSLVEASATMTELLAEMRSQLLAQVPRLRELRQKQTDDPMAFLDGADEADGDIPDNLSIAPTDASTTGTFMTRYTNRSTGTLATNATRKTSKNRRREERKRARGKKGTVYEEEYLVNSIERLIERLNSVGEDVKMLAEGLMRRAMRERAVAVEAAMEDVVEACRGCAEEVFQPTHLSHGDDVDQREHDNVMARPLGGQGVLWEAVTSSKRQKQAPPIKAFERLVLTNTS